MLLATARVAAQPHHLTWIQGVVIGLFQGVAELFPVSSLGHTVLIPKLLGWNNLIADQDSSESFFLAFIVALHVANALALLAFFWRDWVRLIKAFFATLPKRRVETSSERLAWLIVVATIPTGLIGVALDTKVRTLLAKPTDAAVFLMVNGFILFLGERVRRESRQPVGRHSPGAAQGSAPRRRLEALGYGEALMVGVVQSLGLIAGISRDGASMVAGLVRGLDHEDAAKFAFLLATPVILAAGLYKLPELLGSQSRGVGGQIVVGALVTFAASLVTVRFLSQYFKTRTLWPFGVYCVAFGLFMVIFINA